MKKLRIILMMTGLATLLGVMFGGCASTPQSRIERNPQAFQQLPPEGRELVSRGLIREGMGREAVFLAWGSPAQIRVGQRGGQETEFWQYTQLKTYIVDTPTYYPYPYRYSRYYVPMGPRFVHTEVPGRWVLFTNGQVTEWSQPLRR